jgi:hypothetical protein
VKGAKTKIPNHVLDAIALRTGVDHREVSRRPRRQTCPRCRSWTLRGLDADLMAIDVRVDVVPLNPYGEALAHFIGISTWRLSERRDGRLQIDLRDSFAIAANPAGTLESADVVPGHRCGLSWSAQCVMESNLPSRKASSQ